MNYPSNFISRPLANPDQDEDSDIMTALEASASSPPPSSMSSSPQIPGLNLLSAAQFDAQVAARRAASSPITPASKRPKLDPPASSSSSTAPRTLLPSKPRGDSAAKVNDMCQIRHLRTDYDFEEGPPYAFSATLRLLDGDQAIETFEAPGTYGSKKAAKEKVAEMAVTWLEKQPIPKKGQKDAGLLPLAAAKVDPSENWVGVLHGRSSNFSRVRCCDVWPYNDRCALRYACLVSRNVFVRLHISFLDSHRRITVSCVQRCACESAAGFNYHYALHKMNARNF